MAGMVSRQCGMRNAECGMSGEGQCVSDLSFQFRIPHSTLRIRYYRTPTLPESGGGGVESGGGGVESGGGGGTESVTTSWAEPRFPWLRAVISVTPLRRARTMSDCPNCPSMLATLGSATLHFTCPSLMKLPWASCRVAKKPALSPTATVSDGGVTVTDATGPGLPPGVESADESAVAPRFGIRRRLGPSWSLHAAAAIAAAATPQARMCLIVPPVRSERRRKRIPTGRRLVSQLAASDCLHATRIADTLPL